MHLRVKGAWEIMFTVSREKEACQWEREEILLKDKKEE